MELRTAMGQAVKAFRISRGFAQDEAGRSQSVVSSMERGMRSISITDLDLLASSIGVHPLAIIVKGYLLQNQSICTEELIARIRTDLDDLSQARLDQIPLR